MIEKRLNKNFSIADNRIAQCKELDFNAKGLYLYILSLPEDWEFSIERIAYMTNNSIGKVKAGLKQLEAMGLFVRELVYKGVKGKRAKYVLFDFDTRTTANNDESVSIDEKSTDDKSMIEKSTIENQPIDFNTFNKQRNNLQRNNINKIINLQKGACVHTRESEQSKQGEQNEAFKNLNLEAFSKWVKYCEQKNFKIVGIQFDELKKYLCKFDKNKQEQIISYSIANGYKGLYEPKIEQNKLKVVVDGREMIIPDFWDEDIKQRVLNGEMSYLAGQNEYTGRQWLRQSQENAENAEMIEVEIF
ncbi:hypothetical protein [Campylobacter hyointestinalis]|uniref:hypothetical protein n=1 Tax=Campylobacter hyointestinalis TaxID=198 RepID=UPI000DCF25BD|nr:hypothetical protein [Campylobacter hyointestinalis]RAZ38038.1 hypothetical protein CHL9426_07130 [Campylobacter hyointestinalis subsp. lawsonii]RAZ54657.1 hypothetical protein CHL10074_06710 [Campylobacter hyointestinalis subsp. lawsonii]RAZ63359.1 hypothetical protein CHL9767_06915 [Campylobacter hyointestinalis subsp. lawsonii]